MCMCLVKHRALYETQLQLERMRTVCKLTRPKEEREEAERMPPSPRAVPAHSRMIDTADGLYFSTRARESGIGAKILVFLTLTHSNILFADQDRRLWVNLG